MHSIRGVKLVNLGFLSSSSFFFPVACPTLRNSFFLSQVLLVPSSLFLFPFISFASTASSAYMYFSALWSNSVIVFGGLLVIEKKKSPGNNPAWKVVKMTWSSASSTCSSSLLKWVTYCLSDSPSCWMLRRWPVGFFMSLPPNEMTDKIFVELFKICNSSRGYLAEPYYGRSLQHCWECPTHHLIWGHL